MDVRFAAATHRPLEELVREGRFRADLYDRLSAATLAVPALRDRPGDAVQLARCGAVLRRGNRTRRREHRLGT